MNVDIRLCDVSASSAKLAYEQIAALIKREFPSSGTPSVAAIAHIAREDIWILAYRGDALVGILHLRILPTVYEGQLEGRIERVTIDSREKNAEVIDGLLKRAIKVVRLQPVTHIDAQNPAPRIHDNAWYLNNGFAPRDANTYRLAWSLDARRRAAQAAAPTA